MLRDPDGLVHEESKLFHYPVEVDIVRGNGENERPTGPHDHIFHAEKLEGPREGSAKVVPIVNQ